MAISNTVNLRRFHNDNGLHEINATIGGFVALKNSVTKLSADLQNERDRVKMIEDEFVSLKVELVHAWYKYHYFIADCSNDNWDLFRENLHRIFASVGINMDFTLLTQKETNSTPVKLGLADSSSHSQPPSFAFPTFFPFFADQNKQFHLHCDILCVSYVILSI